MSERVHGYCCIGYALIALLTFGYAYNRALEGQFCYSGGRGAAWAPACAAIMVAPLAAAAWPLYWSARLMP